MGQDEEQKRAAEDLENCVGSHCADKESKVWNLNLNTTSGATGQSLLRELACNGVKRRPSFTVDRIISGATTTVMEESCSCMLPKASSSTDMHKKALESLFDRQQT